MECAQSILIALVLMLWSMTPVRVAEMGKMETNCFSPLLIQCRVVGEGSNQAGYEEMRNSCRNTVGN